MRCASHGANLLLALALTSIALQTHATNFVVDSTAASIHAPATPAGMGARCTAAANDCTIYDARIEADGAIGADRIEFNIPLTDNGCNAGTGVCRIITSQSVSSGGAAALTFSDTVEIDATTQPGSVVNTLTTLDGGLNMLPKIEMGGPPPFTPISDSRYLYLVGGGVIRGIAFSRMLSAIKASPAAGKELRVEGCMFGSNATNTLMVGAPVIEADEDTVLNAVEVGESSVVGAGEIVPRVIIGGTTPAQRNWFASHQNAIRMHGTPFALEVLGNVVGTNKDARGRNNDTSGVSLTTWIAAISPRSTLQIGGSDVAARNYFGGQFALATPLTVGSARVQGNYIGAQPDGLTAIPRALGFLRLSAGYLVGGVGAGEGNLFISRNGQYAVQKIAVAAGSQIGGMSRILGNTYRGVTEATYGPSDSPIAYELRSGAGQKNDPGDADQVFSGLRLQNWPQITAYSVVGDQLTLTYRVDSTVPNSHYDLVVEFYLHRLDSAGTTTEYQFLARDTYPAVSALQPRMVTLTIPDGVSLPTDPVIVASATSATVGGLSGETSEFSFHDVALAWDAAVPDVFPVNTVVPITVNVTTTAPFKPHGVLRITRTDSLPAVVICELPVQPSNTASTSTLTCNYTPTQTGALQLTAYWAGTGTTFFAQDQPGQVGSTTIIHDASVQTIVDELFKNGFESGAGP